jgi:hypothetical protein
MSRRAVLLAATALAAPVLVVVTAGPSSSHPSRPAGGVPQRSTSATSAGASGLPACPPSQLTLTGNQTTAVDLPATDATWDLRGAVWDHVAPAPIQYPVRSDAWTRGCIVGAQVNGNVPEGATRDQWYDGKDGGSRLGGEVFRVTLTATAQNYVLIRNTVAQDFEDAYDPNGWSPASAMYLDHVQARYIRDDCIENEGDGPPQVPMSVIVRRSLFDGCFSGFAERPVGAGKDSQNGTGASSLSVDDSMMWIQPQPLGPRYCSAKQVRIGRCRATAQRNVWLGAFGIWKWSRAAGARVTVRNTVFRLDMPSYSTCAAQRWPAGTYRNVWVVWTGSGPYATAGGCRNVLPRGVSLTDDVRAWYKAKAAWQAGRSPVSALRSLPSSTRVYARARGHRVTAIVTSGTGHRLRSIALTLQRRPAGASTWASVDHGRTDVHGVAGTTVHPRGTNWFRWVYGGGPRHSAARSNAVRVSR